MRVLEKEVETNQSPIPTTVGKPSGKKSIFMKRILSLELGTDFIVWTLHAESLTSRKLCDSGIVARKNMSDPEVHRECLNSLIDHLAPAGAEVNLYLSQNDALLRCIYIPVVPRNELRRVVIWECNKVFPFPVDKALFDWRVIDCMDWGGSKKYEVQCAAIPIKEIQPLFELFKSKNLHVKRISLSALAWQEFIHENKSGGGSKPSGNIAMTRLVGGSLYVLFFHDYHLEFIHKSSLESGSLGGSFEESLRFLNEDSPNLLSDSMQTSSLDYGMIAGNISDSMDYYHGQFSQRSIDSVLLCFPDSIQETASGKLRESLGIPVRSVFPAKYDNLSTGEVPLNLFMPSGYQSRNTRKSLNLVPDDYRRSMREKQYFRSTALFSGLLLMFLMVFTFMQYRQEKYLENSRDLLRTSQEEVGNSRLVGQINHLQKERNEYKNALNMLNGKSGGLAVFLKAISTLTPGPVYFTALNVTAGQQTQEGISAMVAITGFVSAEADYPEVVLADYVNSLKGLDFLSNVRLRNQDSQNDSDNGSYGFRLEMELREL